MTKPHEETWTLDEDGYVCRANKHGVYTSPVCLRASTGTAEAQVLIAASPDLARALLDYFRNGDSPARRAAAADALKKAGVI